MFLLIAPASAPEFRVASNTPTTITIDWQPIPRELRYGIITGYRITVRETGEEAIDEDVDASLTEYTLENLMAGRIYQVRMAASTDKGYSTYSSWVTVQTRVVVDSCKFITTFSLIDPLHARHTRETVPCSPCWRAIGLRVNA